MPRVKRMTIGVQVLLGLVLCVLLTPTATFAQATSGASIVGVVKDASGAVLPGVTVEAASPALIEKVRTSVTDDQGRYQITALRPGPYGVTFTLSGFSVLKREGLELAPNFTATVNVELKVGGINEAVTVTGQAPLVDTRSVTRQQVISNTLLDAVPTSKGILAYAALMPSVVSPITAQDVGGGSGEASVRMSIHGSRQVDQKLLQDGMRYNSNGLQGASRSFYINPLAAQENVIEVGGGGKAEASTGGTQVNLIPKDGGNRFSGTFFSAYTNHNFQANNLTPELVSEGLTSINGTQRIYDYNGVVGGPIIEDKLWFTSAHRRWGRTTRAANLYTDANFYNRVPGAPASVWAFTPDKSQPVNNDEENKSDNIRGTWQATKHDKVTLSWDWQQNFLADQGAVLANGTGSIEAINPYCPEPDLIQSTWTHPTDRKLLFEAGATYLIHTRDAYSSFGSGCYGDPLHQSPNVINITELAPRFVYGGVGNHEVDQSPQSNQRFSASYVSGAHNIKAGLFMLEGTDDTFIDRGNIPYTYTFRGGAPNSLTEFVSPTHVIEKGLEAALYLQDQWRASDRLTINLGLRYEYFRAYVPAQTRPATALAPVAASFDKVDCVPCWHDLNPRVGVVYDPVGDGKTAVKVGLDRFVASATATNADPFNPLVASVNSTTRSWTDKNGNFFPDCDLINSAANGECGAMANSSFGQLQIKTRPDPNWITGWGKRGYTWSASVSVDREVRPGVAVSAGYYRTWYGNFTVSDNQETTPADYDPYCITAPTDPRLPGNVSGQQICGLYDITPTKFGLVNNVVTLASNFGTQTEIYNGVDVGFSARFHNGQVSGGWNIGDSVSTGLTGLSSRTNNCFVVDSPQQLYNCQSGNPYLQRIKLNGSYRLPWDLQAAAVFQDLPGPGYTATLTVPSAQIAPSLGRPLAGGTSSVTIDLLQPNSQFVSGRITQLDLRMSKLIHLGGTRRIQANLDLYNALNGSAVLGVIGTYGPTWQTPTSILDGRLFKFGVQFDF